MSKKRTVLGLMSGTSLDGVDAAIVVTDGKKVFQRGVLEHHPYTTEFRGKLRRALDLAAQAGTKIRDAFFEGLGAELTDLHAAAVKSCLEANPGMAGDVSLIGFHGQTLFHKPEAKFTWQLGDGKRLAKATGLDVVYDFRSADVAAGGQGAPFAPLYHRALFQDMAGNQPVAVQNIGGVGNVTWIYGEDILSFDTGPGNALLDDWVRGHTDKPYDIDGKIARAGELNEAIIKAWINHPYFCATPPKSLDRNAWPLENLDKLSLEDGAATLLGFTVGSIIKSAGHFPKPPGTWVITGGGRHNAFMMEQLKNTLGNVVPIENYGLDGDAIEAEAFAYLAMRSTLGLPLSVPGTTGVKEPTTGGVLITR